MMSEAAVRDAVQEALDALPEWVHEEMGPLAVIVEDSHPEGLMGIYDPEAGLERIVVFRDANPDADEVKRTVLHEIGHYFGMDEDDLDRLGYA